MINFSLAGYYSNYVLNTMILALYKTNRSYFYDNIELESIYGTLPGLIWTGCRFIAPIPEINPFSAEIYNLRDTFYDFRIKMRHTFTNSELTQDMLSDYRGNSWLKACERQGNGVIVANDLMANYIRKNYPLYEIIWSTSCGIRDIETVNKISEKEMIVLDYTYNTNSKLLSKLKYPENVEILCAEYCIDNCPNRQQHYKVHNQMILNEEKNRHLKSFCPYYRQENDNFYEVLKKRNHILTHEQIEELYNTYGINHFKLNGRAVSELNYIEILMYYLIKPECRDYVRMLILLGFYEN